MEIIYIDCRFSAGVEKQVNIVEKISEDTYSVIFEERRESFKEICRLIRRQLKEGVLRRITSVKLNKLYIANTGYGLFRVKIIQIDPIVIKFIDFGYEQKIEIEELMCASKEIAEIPALAFLIRTAQFVELEPGSVITIQPIERIAENEYKVVTTESTSKPNTVVVASKSQLSQLQPSKKAKKQATVPTAKVVTIRQTEESTRRESVEEAKITEERETTSSSFEENCTMSADRLEVSENAIDFNAPRQKAIKKFTLQPDQPNPNNTLELLEEEFRLQPADEPKQNHEMDSIDDEWRSMLDDDWSEQYNIQLPSSCHQTDERTMWIAERDPSVGGAASSALSDEFATLSMDQESRRERNKRSEYTVDLTSPPSVNERSSRSRRSEDRQPVAVIDLTLENEESLRSIEGTPKEVVQRSPPVVDLTGAEDVDVITVRDGDISVPVNVSRLSKRSIRSLRDLISDDSVSSVSGSDDVSVKNLPNEQFSYRIKIPLEWDVVRMLKTDDEIIFVLNSKTTGMLIYKKGKDAALLDELSEHFGPSYHPKRGSFVIVYLDPESQHSNLKYQDPYCRGYVLYEPSIVDPYYTVLLIDRGIQCRVKEVSRLPRSFKNVPILAVRCEIYDDNAATVSAWKNLLKRMISEYEDEQSGIHHFKGKVVSAANGTVVADICEKVASETSTTFRVMFTSWTPSVEELELRCVQVHMGDRVKLTAVESTSRCYICPTEDDVDVEKNIFLEEVVDAHEQERTLNRCPDIGEIICVPYSGSYRRAKILQENKESYIAHVVDVGVNVKILKDDIKSLPDDLKAHKRYSVGVCLSKVPETDFTKEANKFLKFMVADEIELVLKSVDEDSKVELTFTEEFHKNGVVAAKGTSLNVHLRKLLTPEWKRRVENDLYFGNQVFYLNMMKFDQWEINSQLTLHVTEVSDSGELICYNKDSPELIKMTKTNFLDRLKEYAEETEDPYVPTKTELCVAFSEGKWQRAVCMNAESGQDLELQFIDTGCIANVSHTEIRSMEYEFTIPLALSCFCEITNRDHISDDRLYALKGKYLKNCVVEGKTGVDSYTVRVPDLQTYLTAL